MDVILKPAKQVFLFLLLAVLFTSRLSAQNDSTHLRISVLTCAPGAELYSTFGHCAIRVIDSSRQMDAVFNYGTFDFDDPHFYTKFVKGKLDYMLAVQSFPDFMSEYVYEHRSVWEEVLNLSPEQKQTLVKALEHNLEGNNRYYKYDFLLDNCSTRPRDLLYNTLPQIKLEKAIIPEGTTSRNLIHYYLDNAGQVWSKLGIDILLGDLLDKPIDSRAAMFLPEFLRKAVEQSSNNGRALVLSEKSIISEPTPITPSWKYTPLMVVSIAVFLFFVLYVYGRKNKTAIRIADSFLLYLTGLLGVLLLFMWIGTDHTVCRNNFNLLWALPTNLVVAFFTRHRKWLGIYFFLAFLATAVLLGGWFWLPQEFNIAIIPLAILLLYRYAVLYTENRKTIVGRM